MREIMTGNSAVVEGVVLCRPKVVTAYPITPQTTIVEEISEVIGEGRLEAKFIPVESEHSAMASAAAAASCGVRVFTATSSHGLAFMHEMLSWVSGARLPVVMVNVNRAVGAPWSIWTDQTDSLMQRDTGWIQIYCASAQEALDTVIQAYRLAEELSNPVMICYDGFTISHTVEPVEVPSQDIVDVFLPPLSMANVMDYQDPHTFHILAPAPHYGRFRHAAHKSMVSASEILETIDEEFKKRVGRGYGLIETYRNEDAELSLVAMSSIAGTAKKAVDILRGKGKKVGLVRQRLFRPSPERALKEAFEGKRIAILDRDLSSGMGGILAQEIKAVLWSMKKRPEVHEFIVGLGGQDVTIEMICSIADQALTEPSNQGPVWVEI